MRERPTGPPVRDWARWSATAAERPWTVGIEEEVMLLEPLTWALANRIDHVLAVLPPEVVAHASAEIHACVVELKTAAHLTVAGGRLRPDGSRATRLRKRVLRRDPSCCCCAARASQIAHRVQPLEAGGAYDLSGSSTPGRARLTRLIAIAGYRRGARRYP
jgi:hypothetical protein